jgi:dihydrofolate synthase/folylpolyglutamate synthase
MISDEDLWALIGEVNPIVNSIAQGDCGCPTEFEILAAIAFQYFAVRKADIAVIEAGMGGIIDSTNVVTPLVKCDYQCGD